MISNDSKNILYIIDTTGPGGAETVLLNIVKNLDHRRFRPSIALPDIGWLYQELKQLDTMDVAVIPGSKGRFNWLLLRVLSKLLRQKKIDIVHCHLFGSSLYGSMLGLSYHIPVVCTFHGTFDFALQDPLLGLKSLIINKGSTKLTFVSKFLQEYFITKTQLSQKKSEVVYNGIYFHENAKVDLIEFKRKYGINGAEFVIGCVGNIKPVKGYDILIRAASEMLKKERNCRFLIAGEPHGNHLEFLLGLRAHFGLERSVTFLGYQPDVAKVYSLMDLFVLPSLTEGFSLSTIEAMGYGIPAIVTKCGGPEEIIRDGENGYVIERNRSDLLSAAILKLLRDNDLRKKMGLYGMESVRARFGIRRMVDSYQDIYDVCLHKKPFYWGGRDPGRECQN
jgi:glycosyltransferase involved in cell wall biosynthesis